MSNYRTVQLHHLSYISLRSDADADEYNDNNTHKGVQYSRIYKFEELVLSY